MTLLTSHPRLMTVWTQLKRHHATTRHLEAAKTCSRSAPHPLLPRASWAHASPLPKRTHLATHIARVQDKCAPTIAQSLRVIPSELRGSTGKEPAFARGQQVTKDR